MNDTPTGRATVGQFEKFICWGDSHGDHVDRSALVALEKHIADFKPKHRICLGDAFDFGALRQGISNSEGEKYDDLVSDWTAGMMMLTRTKPTVFLNGNHEYRMYRVAAEGVGLYKEYAKDGVKRLERELRKLGAKVYPYHHEHGVHRIRRVAFVHGYTANMASVKQHAEIYAEPGGAVLMGHLHRLESVNAIRHGGAKGYSCGMLADKTKLLYAAHRTATARWENGWCYGLIGKKGFKVWTAEKVEGTWLTL